MCRNDMSSGSKLPPSASYRSGKRTLDAIKGAQIESRCAVPLSFFPCILIKELGLRRSFFIISFSPRSHFSLEAQLAALCQRAALLLLLLFYSAHKSATYRNLESLWRMKVLASLRNAKLGPYSRMIFLSASVTYFSLWARLKSRIILIWEKYIYALKQNYSNKK